ncbi:hypothetical protein F8388_002063 [Cannabis sativa]|uniref:Uncharacterized protein n=1 Tax=Cannabis sativa TaxID=3483 RepID=A0A7J6E371_CANSA|nr:hypothetical protein F8388_002063 [Cannabis sativa]
MDKGKQTPPPVLTYVPHSFDLDMPVMLKGISVPSLCFLRVLTMWTSLRNAKKPACYFVVKDYGHLDMLDDETKGN